MNNVDIIVANEDLVFLEMMCDILQEEGYTVRIANEKQDAFDEIKRYQPRLVILELTITDPESGWMVLNKMRLWPDTTNTPVVIASTATQLIRDNEQHLRSKNCTILMKPFTLDELLAEVRESIG